MVNQDLLVEFLRVYAFQPATAFWRAIETSLLRKHIPRSGICLDLGCGDGKLTRILFGNSPLHDLTLVGIDNDQDETHQAKQLKLYARIHTCPASNIPEPPSSFDHVISNSVLEHVEDIAAIIAEVARLLKDEGTFVFTVPAPGFHHCLKGPLFQKGHREKYLRELDQRLAHYRYWGIDEWQEILITYGIVIEEHWEYFSCPEVRRWETISRFTAGVLYFLSRRQYSPITLQKRLGLRQTQNNLTLPRWLAQLLAKTLSWKLGESQDTFSGLLIVARKFGESSPVEGISN